MIAVTEKAAQKALAMIIEAVQSKKPEDKPVIGIRAYVKGGGCHGYQYGMQLETEISADDTVIDAHGVTVIMDP